MATGKRRAQGEGTVFQRHAKDCPRKAGTAKTCACPWWAQVYHGWIGGRRVRPARIATRDDGKRPTKADAIRKRDEMMIEKRAGILPTTATVGAWLDYWLEHVVDPAVADGRLKTATSTYYRSYCEQWLTPALGRQSLTE